MNNITSLVISIIALIVSGYSVLINRKYARIATLQSTQNLLIQKAKDCNELWKKASEMDFHDPRSYEYRIADVIIEITTSLTILENSISNYSLEKERDFLTIQFWAQLNNSTRVFIFNSKFEKHAPEVRNLVSFIQATFEKYTPRS